MDWSAAVAYLGSLRTASRLPRRQPPADGAMPVDLSRVLSFRARAMHLHHRMGPGRLTEAAAGGLQDSAPRSGLLSLHARVEGVEPASWEDPSLAQVWFRMADYVVPRADIGVFTVGRLPRRGEHAAGLEQLAGRVLDVLDGQPGLPRAVERAIPDLPHHSLVRAAAATGRYLIRWDARITTIVPIDRPAIDAEDARRELARRFLRWLGPASVGQFARWAGVTAADAKATWAALKGAGELLPVDLEGEGRSLLKNDEASLSQATPIEGVRLLPPGDPYLFLDQPGGPELPFEPRVNNSLTGRLLVDQEVVGSWARKQTRITIFAWKDLPATAADRVMAEVDRFAGPLGGPAQARWIGEGS